jgi:hypothetical protein
MRALIRIQLAETSDKSAARVALCRTSGSPRIVFFLQQFLIDLRNSIVDELDEPRFLLGMSRVQT